jgi:secondary thiamine-phosphate synthase enzyme
MATVKCVVPTSSRSDMVEVTGRVAEAVRASGMTAGAVTVFVPHTTAGVTINENADPDVVHDVLRQLDEMVPWDRPFYRHGEGNSASHVKASMMGSSVRVLVEAGRLMLGRWQGVWLCEFDGPRRREVWVRLEPMTG